MASRGKKKTTMAKLNRESKLQERRIDKQARKDARKRAAADGVTDEQLDVPAEDEGLLSPEVVVQRELAGARKG